MKCCFKKQSLFTFGRSIFVSFLLLIECRSISVDVAPHNISAPVGENVTIGCQVSDFQPADIVMWQQVHSTGNLQISSNDVIINAAFQSKFFLSSEYNLTITDVSDAETGTYACVVGGVSYTAHFTAVSLPTNLSIYWSNKPEQDTLVNLTCLASFGKPAPMLRWFRDDVDVNERAIFEAKRLTTGYDISMSNIEILVTRQEDNIAYRCEVEYDGYPRAMEYTFITHFSNGDRLTVYPALTVALLLVSLHLAH